MKRRYAVDLSTTITIEVDDEAVSDWDGRTILTVHENRERWSRDGVTRDDVIGMVAITVGTQGGRVGGSDGWADFPEGTVTEHGWPQWSVDRVTAEGSS